PRAALPVIDVKTAIKDLLPVPPKFVRTEIYTGDDLRRVPEAHFEGRPDSDLTTEQWDKRKAHTVAAALHLNARQEDGFLKALIKERQDLRGMPFVMGDKCRTKGYRVAAFKGAAGTVRPLNAERLSLALAKATK